MSTTKAAMALETLSYEMQKGWSVPAFPPLDSEQTLVMVFGAPEFSGNSGPIEELRRAYPTSTIFGCSTAGEIHGATLLDRSMSVAVLRLARTRLATPGHRFDRPPTHSPRASRSPGNSKATPFEASSCFPTGST